MRFIIYFAGYATLLRVEVQFVQHANCALTALQTPVKHTAVIDPADMIGGPDRKDYREAAHAKVNHVIILIARRLSQNFDKPDQYGTDDDAHGKHVAVHKDTDTSPPCFRNNRQYRL